MKPIVTSTSTSAAWKAAIPVIGLALLLATALTYEFFPGFISYDSLQQFRQTLGLIELRDAHPVILVYLWRWLLKLYDHAGVLLAFHQVLYWSGIGVFVCLATEKLWLRILLLLAIGLSPPLLILSLHLWKDVDMLGGLAVASAMMLGYIRRPHAGWLAAAALALFFAIAVRINGLIPALPLLLLMCYLGARRASTSIWKVASVTATAAIAFVMVSSMAVSLISSGAKKVYGLGTLLVWDMVSISLAENENLLPAYLARHTEGDLLPQLEALNSREANYPSYALVSPFPPKSLEKQLIKDWLTLVAQHPEAYLRHRTHVFSVLLGIGNPEIYYPYHPGIDENEFHLKFENISKTELQAYLDLFDELARSIIYRPWIYLVLALVVAMFCTIRVLRRSGNQALNLLSISLAISGILSAVSLFVIATAADYRYITWTILAAMLSAVTLGADVLGRVDTP